MKAILPYIVMFAGSFIMVCLVMGGMYFYRPDLLGFSPANASAKADSTAAHATLRMYGPTLLELKGKDLIAMTRDTLAAMRDSIRTLGRLLAAEKIHIDSLQTGQNAPVAVAAAVDSSAAPQESEKEAKDRKAMTKMLESMAADNVVKLLRGMSDEEVKELLLSLKTKQAAKILAALDPDRAAKLIR